MADLAVSARQAAAAIAAFAKAWKEAAPDESPPPPPPRLIDGTLVGRELTYEDLVAMFEREFPGKVKGERRGLVKGYCIDPVLGRVVGRCIFSFGPGGSRSQQRANENSRITALALKHLIDFDEDLFLDVSDCDGRTTR